MTCTYAMIERDHAEAVLIEAVRVHAETKGHHGDFDTCTLTPCSAFPRRQCRHCTNPAVSNDACARCARLSVDRDALRVLVTSGGR